MVFFYIVYLKIAKKMQKSSKKNKSKIIFERNYQPENAKEMQKTVFIWIR